MVKAFTKSDIPPHTPAEVAEILSYIPPAPPNDDWVKICASVCSEIGEAEALPVLLAWSPDYGDKKTETVLRSFGGTYTSTIATVIDIAQKNGFNASAYEKARFARLKAESGNTPASPRRERKEKADTAAPQSTKPQPAKTGTQQKTQQPAPHFLPPEKIGKCSICENVRKPASIKETDLLACLKAIKSGKWKNEIEALRAGKREKSTIPQINAFGVYRESRKDENLASRSGFLVLDYDGKDNPKTDFHTLKSRLSRLPFVLAAFTSPSGNGLKALIRIPAAVNDSAAFNAAAEILAPLGGKIDAQSEARKHFIVSYDETAFISETPLDEIPPLPAKLEELKPETLAVLFADTAKRITYTESGDIYFENENGFRKLSEATAREEFTIRHGVNVKTARKILYAIRQRPTAAAVFPALSCHKRGKHVLNNRQVLVLESPQTIEAEEGTFPTIRKMLETVFPAKDFEQLARFLAWLQTARRAYLRAVESNGAEINPVPVLMILGTIGAGKDLLFGSLIQPALGDREASRMNSWTKENQWLADNIGTECILGSELPALSPKERNAFTQTVKQILGGQGYHADGKFLRAQTFKGLHFLVLLANIDDGGNCAACCPNTSDKDFSDKFLALAISNSEAVKREFSREKKTETSKAIRRELPAFLYWLETYFEFPDEWKDDRFGVASYTARRAALALYEISLAGDLEGKLELLCDREQAKMFSKSFSATEIAEMLASRFGGKMLSAVAIGRALAQLCEARPDFIEYKSHKYRFKRASETAAEKTEPPPAFASPFAGMA